MPDVQNAVTWVSVTYKSASMVAHLAQYAGLLTQVVIVDNASDDGTAELIRKSIPQAKIIENTVNTGFGAGNNLAVQQVTTEFALLANPDIALQLVDIEAMLNTMRQYPQAALLAPQGWHSQGKPQLAYRQAFYEKRPKAPYRVADGTLSARWLHGCCLLVRVEAFKAIGGFDENFFLYYEDDDLCLRALAAGYDCLVEPKANIMHLGGASSTPSWRVDFKKQFHFFHSRRRIIQKYQGPMSARIYHAKILLAAPFAVLVYVLSLRRKYIIKWTAWGAGALAALLHPKHQCFR